jgi:ribosomal protein S12 methylthiotransferase accessory factor
MAVDLVGTGPAAAAVRAALADVDIATSETTAETVGGELSVVVGDGDDRAFRTANEIALEADGRWIAVELGGIGGHGVVDASIAGFGPDTACYECLAGRVSANLESAATATVDCSAPTARFAGATAGRAAATYLTDGDTDPFGSVVEVPHATRAVLPLPGCVCDAGSDHPISLAAVDSSLDASLARAERGLDERVGIVHETGEAESLPAPYYLARACDTTGFSDAAASRDAAGVAAGWDAAFMKALGEAMERYAAGVYRLDDLVEAPAGAVDGAVWPGAFVCRSEPTGNETIRWVEGVDLHTESAVSLPAAFVHYPPETERFRPAITTGLGLSNGGCGAVLSGLYEVLERDATMLAWYSTFEPLGLDVDDDGFDDLVARARVADLDVTPLLLTQDVDVPVVAVAVHRDTWPRLALGSAADLDADLAARSALAEGLQNWMELRGMGAEAAESANGAIGRYADFPDSIRPFVTPDAAVPTGSVGPETVPGGRDELAAVLDRVEDASMTAYAAPTTTRGVRSLGFRAVRVLVPGAQPLFFGDPYFGDRARSVPRQLGFEPALDREHHPFP